jgi:hypothetical protein
VVTSLVSISRVQGFLQSEEPEPTLGLTDEPPKGSEDDKGSALTADATPAATALAPATDGQPASAGAGPSTPDTGAGAVVVASAASRRPPLAPRATEPQGEVIMRLRGASFKWTRNQPTPTLTDVSIDIHKGRLIGVVGLVRGRGAGPHLWRRDIAPHLWLPLPSNLCRPHFLCVALSSFSPYPFSPCSGWPPAATPPTPTPPALRPPLAACALNYHVHPHPFPSLAATHTPRLPVPPTPTTLVYVPCAHLPPRPPPPHHHYHHHHPCFSPHTRTHPPPPPPPPPMLSHHKHTITHTHARTHTCRWAAASLPSCLPS